MCRAPDAIAKADGVTRAASRPSDVRATLTELLIRTGIPPQLAASTAKATIDAGWEARVMRTLRARCSAAAPTRAGPGPAATGDGASSLPAGVVERVCAFAGRGDAPPCSCVFGLHCTGVRHITTTW